MYKFLFYDPYVKKQCLSSLFDSDKAPINVLILLNDGCFLLFVSVYMKSSRKNASIFNFKPYKDGFW